MAVPFSQRNFQKELEQLLNKLTKEGHVPSLLLHSCCAPCRLIVNIRQQKKPMLKRKPTALAMK